MQQEPIHLYPCLFLLLKACDFVYMSKYYIYAFIFNTNHILLPTIQSACDVRLYNYVCKTDHKSLCFCLHIGTLSLMLMNTVP